MQNISVTVAALIEQNNHFLIVEEVDKQGQTVFNQPAGHVEHGESIIDAVVREVKEETNLDFTPMYLIGTYFLSPANNGNHYLRFCFGGEADSSNALNPNDKDIIACHRKSIKEIAGLDKQLRSGLVLNCLADYLSGQRYPLDGLHHVSDEVRAMQTCYDRLKIKP